MSDENFERHALAILQRELGLDGLARFLRLYRSGSGDYNPRSSPLVGRRHNPGNHGRSGAPGQARCLENCFRSTVAYPATIAP